MSAQEYNFALAVEREKLVRIGELKPINLAEERQLAEGPRAPSELDCAKNSTAGRCDARSSPKHPETSHRSAWGSSAVGSDG